MSAPETNTKKQERQHKTPLAGMAWVVGFAVLLLIVLVVWLSWGGNEPGNGQSAVEEQSAGGDVASPDAATGEASD